MAPGAITARPDRDPRLAVVHLAGLVVATALGVALILGTCVAAVLVLIASVG